MFDSECATNVLQVATRAVTPHQREVQYDYPAVSFFLRSLLILATAILEANGGCRSVRTRCVLTRKAWPSRLQGWTRKSACQGPSPSHARGNRTLRSSPIHNPRAVDTSLGKHILDVAVAQSEAEIEPDGLLDDDARTAVTVV